MAKTAATSLNPEDKPMFMKDFTAITTEFALVKPRPALVIPAPVVCGIVAGTLVEATNGWVAVETLRIGDKVQTLDGGLARILGLDRRQMSPEAETSLIHLPGGCHDACSDLMLVPGQHLLVDTLGDEEMAGAPFALVPAVALTTDPLVRRTFPDGMIEVTTLLFADEEVIFANSGVLMHCPSIVDGAGRYPDNSFFPRLDAAAARRFLNRRAARLDF
jgi:Hint domain